ncbi:MAG: acVLRF1 family peptidyl-tRNA hydrolase [Marmoricola sp.]
MAVTTLTLPPARLERWVENFTARHGDTTLAVSDGRLTGAAVDGSTFAAALPFSRSYTGAADVVAFLGSTAPPGDWAVLLVRKGGFAVARLQGPTTTASKVGQRHVQGRTKAGGQSQQRFARRRDNQARAAYEAAADHAARLIADAGLVVIGGDQGAVTAVLEDPRLRRLAGAVAGTFLTVPDPRRGVLEGAVEEASSVTMSVVNT